MPLYVTALALENDGLRVAIVDVDILILSAGMDAEARDAVVAATGVPAQNIRIAYSHTHSGPAFISRWITEGADLAKEWLDALPGQITDTVQSAFSGMQPVNVASGAGSCDININRRPEDEHGSRFTGRNWKDPVDHEVGVVAMDTLAGDPLATLMVYACHPTIMGHANKMVTPDFPGPARRVVEQTVGGTCLFLQGAGGNQGPVHGFTGDLNVYRREGTKLGLEAARVRMDLDPFKRRERLVEILPSGADLGIYDDEPVSQPDDTLAVSWAEADLPLRELRPLQELETRFEEAAAEVDRLREAAVAGEGESNPSKEMMLAISKAQKANIALNCVLLAERHAEDGHVSVSVQAIRIGETVLVAVPLEPFAEIGMDIKAKSPASRTFFSGFSNGHYNYLPTDIGIEEGGYEVDVSPFAAGSAGLVTQASLEAIERVWR